MIEKRDFSTYPYFIFGTFLQRMGAYLIDILMIRIFSNTFLNLYELFGFWDTGARFGLFNMSRILLYLLYFTVFTKVSNGQTLGKMIFGLRVVSFAQEKLTWSDVFIREFIGRYIQKKIKLFYLVLFLTKKRQTLADVFTETSVISEKSYFDFESFTANSE